MSKKRKKPGNRFQNSTNRDYVCILGTYIHKRICKIMLFILLLIPVSLLVYEIVYTYHQSTLEEREKITYRYDSAALAGVEGYVILVNDKGERVYEGDFANGKCNGPGKVYKHGELRYAGNLVDNQYEDEKGTQYDDKGNPLYEGGFVKGVYQGEGILYYPSGTYHQQGTFVNGQLSGKGVTYHEDGSLAEEGTYVFGKLNGLGISYYEGSNVRRYEGEFMGGDPIGEGTLFQMSGRAWYKGRVYGYEPDYESYIGATFAQIREHFFDQVEIYKTSDNCAMAIPKQKVVFISTQKYEVISDKDKAEVAKTEIEQIDKAESTGETKGEEAAKTPVVAVDETKLFIQGISLLNQGLPGGALEMYQNGVRDGVYQYGIHREVFTYMDMYTMHLFKKIDNISPYDMFIKVVSTKGEVSELTMNIAPIEIDRYTITMGELKEMKMQIGTSEYWNYRIVIEQKEAAKK